MKTGLIIDLESLRGGRQHPCLYRAGGEVSSVFIKREQICERGNYKGRNRFAK